MWVVFADNLKTPQISLPKIGALEGSVGHFFAKIGVGFGAHSECKFATAHHHIVCDVRACVGLAVPQYFAYIAVFVRQSFSHHTESCVLANGHFGSSKARYA